MGRRTFYPHYMLKTCVAYVCIHTKYYISNIVGYFYKNQDLFTLLEFLNSPPVAHHISFLCYAALRFAGFCFILFCFVWFFFCLILFVCFVLFCFLLSLFVYLFICSFFISPMRPMSLDSLFRIVLSGFSNICSSVNCPNLTLCWLSPSALSAKRSSIGWWLNRRVWRHQRGNQHPYIEKQTLWCF